MFLDSPDWFHEGDLEIKGNEGHITKATWSPTAFAVFNRTNIACRRSRYVTRPKDFDRWIEVAVQDTENDKFKKQKAGVQRSATDEAVLRQVELDTLVVVVVVVGLKGTKQLRLYSAQTLSKRAQHALH